MPYVATRRSPAPGAPAPEPETNPRRAPHSGDGFPVFPVEPGWWFRPMLVHEAQAAPTAWDELFDSGHRADDPRDRAGGVSVAAALEAPVLTPEEEEPAGAEVVPHFEVDTD